MREPPDQLQVLAPGEVLVDRGVLAGETDRAAHPVRVLGDVEAEHLARPPSGQEQRGEDAHRGGLARAVRPEQAEHAPTGTSNDTPPSAVTSPKRLTSPSARIAIGACAHASPTISDMPALISCTASRRDIAPTSDASPPPSAAAIARRTVREVFEPVARHVVGVRHLADGRAVLGDERAERRRVRRSEHEGEDVDPLR